MWKRLRKWLRIAVTALSLLVCALQIALCVRSCVYSDYFVAGIPGSSELTVYSSGGSLSVALWRDSRQDAWSHVRWDVPNFGPVWNLKWDGAVLIAVAAPYWFYVTIFATLAALPWIKWRFSLRTLLIVLTLFALFFGAIAMSL